jgi:hypothetical protein
MVAHCLIPAHLKDWQTTEFVLTMMNDILRKVSADGDAAELTRLQNKFSQSGAVQMVVDVMMAKPDAKTVQLALALGVLLLQPENKEVQDAFVSYFYTIDDSGLWQVFVGLYDQVSGGAKYARS